MCDSHERNISGRPWPTATRNIFKKISGDDKMDGYFFRSLILSKRKYLRQLRPPSNFVLLIIHILASCVFADIREGWRLLPQLKHNLSISIVHRFLAFVPNKTQTNFICLPFQQSVKTSLKMEVTHTCNCGLRHQFSPIILPVKSKSPLVLLSYQNNLKLK